MTPTTTASSTRTRFAPSPTGPLHLGNMRTAILNWLFARHAGGDFVLRLEDTDTERNVDGGEDMIYAALDWLGLTPDEGPREGGDVGPYRQSERGQRYEARAAGLLESGEAFRCFCTTEELEAHRKKAIAAGEAPGRDPRCRNLSPEQAEALAAEGRPAAIRLLVPSGPVEFHDRLKGLLAIDGDDLGDMVLVRSDGRATYNFAVAVDDLEMQITHVIRGVGHLSNTPKQALLYRAFGVEPPEFVHIPTVLAPGGGKLSKRAGATSILEYRDQGYHADAILNYLSLLSWSSEDGEEFLSRDVLIERIDLDRIGAADAEVDEDKMTWLSGQHLRGDPPATLAAHWTDAGRRLGLQEDELIRAAEVFAKRTQLFSEAFDELAAVFTTPNTDSDEARAALNASEASIAIGLARDTWTETEWRPEALKPALSEAARAAGIPGRAFFGPVRVALMGAAHGPDVAEVAYALGRPRTLERFGAALQVIDSEENDVSREESQ